MLASGLIVSRCQEPDDIDIADVGLPVPEDSEILPPGDVMTPNGESEFMTSIEATNHLATTQNLPPPSTAPTTTTPTTTITQAPSTSTAQPASHSPIGDDVIASLQGKVQSTNERLMHLLSEKEQLSARLQEVSGEMVSMRAQVHGSLEVMHHSLTNASSQTNSSLEFIQQEVDQKIESLRQKLELLVQDIETENDRKILVNNRIIVISLSVISVPISFLLILIIYLTFRRDKKIVKTEQRLALNEMNHLRRYNDY